MNKGHLSVAGKQRTCSKGDGRVEQRKRSRLNDFVANGVFIKRTFDVE